MRSLTPWLLLVGGCFDPTIANGVPCAEYEVCPGNLTCYGGTCLSAPPSDAAIDTPVDAAPPTCNGIPEGAVCDDRNICTSASTCQLGICTAPQPVASCTVAESETEFSSTQGTSGWTYGIWRAEIDIDGVYTSTTDFEAAAFTANAWRPNDYAPMPAPTFSWAQTSAWGGHPGANPRKLPIRRWTSDVQGPAQIAILHRKSDTTGGDGTRAILFVGGGLTWMHDVAGTDGVGSTSMVDIELSVGTTVDFLLDSITDDDYDSTYHRMTITSR